MSKSESNAAQSGPADDDEPDEWDKRIFSTGCSGTSAAHLSAVLPSTNNDFADENMKLTDCYFEKKDWRQCTAEMEVFKKCWKQHGNNERTDAKDA